LTIEEVLREKGVYVGVTTTDSMQPLLLGGRDTIVVRPKTEPLKPLDVALYRRGDKYILHRVISVLDDGYLIRGDNCYYEEIVDEKDVIGILTEFYHKDKRFFCTDKKYLRYAKKRVKRYKFRYFWHRVKNKLISHKNN